MVGGTGFVTADMVLNVTADMLLPLLVDLCSIAVASASAMAAVRDVFQAVVVGVYSCKHTHANNNLLGHCAFGSCCCSHGGAQPMLRWSPVCLMMLLATCQPMPSARNVRSSADPVTSVQPTTALCCWLPVELPPLLLQLLRAPNIYCSPRDAL